MRTDLKVPYAEKDQARKRGARWDAAKKVWFVENVERIAKGRDAALSRRVPLERRVGRQNVTTE